MLKVAPIQIPTQRTQVPGLIVFGDSYDEAIQLAYMTRDHFELPGPKSTISVSFHDDGPKTVTMQIAFSPEIGSISISEVDREVVLNIIDGLQRVEKYVILLGHDIEALTVIDSRTFNLFKSDISYNGTVVTGNSIDKVNWNSVL